MFYIENPSAAVKTSFDSQSINLNNLLDIEILWTRNSYEITSTTEN